MYSYDPVGCCERVGYACRVSEKGTHILVKQCHSVLLRSRPIWAAIQSKEDLVVVCALCCSWQHQMYGGLVARLSKRQESIAKDFPSACEPLIIACLLVGKW